MAVTQQHLDVVLEDLGREGHPVLNIAPVTSAMPGIPAIWKKILSSSTARTDVLDILWKPMAPRFKRTLRIFKSSLQGVGLLTTDARPPSIIYFLTLKKSKNPTYYRGFVPAAKLPPEAKSLPDEFLKFYQIHDGWIDDTVAMGPLPSRDWHFLDGDPKEPTGKYLIVYFGNHGDRLVYDLGQAPPLCYHISSSDPPSRVVPQIWMEMDKWVAWQLEGLLPYSSK